MQRALQMTAVICLLTALIWPTSAEALGAAAGATISNLATITYSTGGSPQQVAASASFKVDELIDLELSTLELTPKSVLPGATNAPLSFRLTNTGNGTEVFTLALNNTISGDTFDPTAATPDAIFLDDGDGLFDDSLDTPYSAGTNDPLLIADESIVIFVLNDFDSGLSNGDSGISELTATAVSGNGTAWTSLGANSGDNNSTAVLGSSGGQGQATASYLVSTLTLNLIKAATVTDPDGGSTPVPEAVITYTIEATISGTGVLENIIVTDPIPANTSYVSDSLRLNNVSLSDSSDDDSGDVGQTTLNTVTVTLGSMDETSASKLIEFKVKIN